VQHQVCFLFVLKLCRIQADGSQITDWRMIKMADGRYQAVVDLRCVVWSDWRFWSILDGGLFGGGGMEFGCMEMMMGAAS